MAKLNLKNARRWLQAHRNIVLDKIGALPEHKQEQVFWRSTFCRDCLKNGKCASGCGCPAAKVLMADEACELKRWPDMMDAPEWAEFKANPVNGIELTVIEN